MKCSLVRVYVNSQGYTSSGHYYGTGLPLYHAYDESRNLDCHLRAVDRGAAIAMLKRDNPGIEFYRED